MHTQTMTPRLPKRNPAPPDPPDVTVWVSLGLVLLLIVSAVYSMAQL